MKATVYAVRPYYGSNAGYYVAKTTVRMTAPTLSSLTGTCSTLEAAWSKVTGASGYQIQYSTDSSFSSSSTQSAGSSATSCSIPAAGGGTYYVRIRDYKTVDGTAYYSAWSSAKSITANGSHDYDGTVTKEATCEEDGEITYTCSSCGDSYTETIEAIGHDYELAETTGDICTEGGFATYTCKNCGDTYTEVSAATGHVSEGWEILAEATCTEDGLMVEKCIYCDEILDTKIIEATGHDYEVTDATEDTCTQGGTVTYTCSNCGDTYTEESAATGHVAGEWEIQTEATCTADGLKVQKCVYCGEILDSEVIEATGHDYTSEVAAEATCEEDGKITYTCGNCGDSYTETEDALDHDWVLQEENVKYQKISCNTCKAIYYTYSEWDESDCSIDHGAYTVSTPYGDMYKCSRCGEIKYE